MYYFLFYEKVPGFAEIQRPQAEAHRTHLDAAVERGELILAGPLKDPDNGAALLMFRGGSPDLAERFAKIDPYVVHGVVAKWWVRSWEFVVGSFVP